MSIQARIPINGNVNKEILEKARKKIALQTGLDFTRVKYEDLERELVRVGVLLNYKNTEELISDYLMERLSPEQVIQFIEAITIGETYFFRDDQIFEALEKIILPNLVEQKRSSNKPIRIWSSGCANGEEPYSIAILMDRLQYLLNGVEVFILATDLNMNALNRAENGVFTEWSFRNTAEWIQNRYFRTTSDNKFSLLPEIMEKVHFEYLNLAENYYPSLLNHTNDMDLIICKNVLMYLTEERVSSVLKQFSLCLQEGGLLIVSACEVSNRMLSEFSPINYPGCILYQKLNPHVKETPLHPINPEILSDLSALTEIIPTIDDKPLRDAQYVEVERKARECVRINPKDVEALENLCRLTANQGHLEEALEMSGEMLGINKLSPTYHYLRAMILFELEAFEEASISLRKSLFLDDQRAITYFMLGSISKRLGLPEEARDHFRNALDILNLHGPEMIVQDTEGLQVIQLTELIQEAIRSL